MNKGLKKIIENDDIERKAKQRRETSDDVLENVYELLILKYKKKKDDGQEQ